MFKPIYYTKLWIKMPRVRKQLLLKAIQYSLQMEYYIRFNKSQQLAYYQRPQTETPLQTPEQRRQVAAVARMIRIVDKRMPWNPMCLNLSLTARRLLNEQNINTTLHIGFKPRTVNKNYEGHAWLTIDKQLITGWLPDLATYRELK